MRTSVALALCCVSFFALALAGCGAVETGECTLDPNAGCGPGATCVDENGTTVCRCSAGFTGDGTTCADVDECATSPCHAMASCSNTAGSFACACNSGYTGNGMTCAPVDCGVLTSPANGSVTTPSGTTYGQTATYACNPMHRLVGDTMRMCQANGQWSGSAPACNPCVVQTVTLTAVQSLSVNYPAGGTYTDNNNRAYDNPSGGCAGNPTCDITGWSGFNMSVIPDTATITAMTMRNYATTVQMGPTVRIQYSTANDWTRATPGTNIPRSVAQVSPPSTPAINVYNAHTIVVDSFNWQADLADNFLTLGVDNTNTAYSYAYYNGSDPGGNQPTLSVTFCD